MDLGALLLSALAGLAVASAAVSTMRRAAPRSKTLPLTANWIEELSVDRYRPMLRLLDAEELRRLAAEGGLTPEALAAARSERCRIFREYLRSLRGDFARICAALKILMATAAKDRPDLASILLKSQLRFAMGIAVVEVRLALSACGIGSVDMRSLLAVFDGLRLELRAVAPTGIRAA